MSFSGKDGNRANMATNKMDMRGQNGKPVIQAPAPTDSLGSSASFRTDSAISGSRFGGERVLQRWQPDASDDVDGSLEGPGSKSSGGWDQFAENSRRFGLTTDYNEDIYTTTIDKSHPQYKQRLADAERKEREILRSAANNSHVAEERVTDNLNANGNGVDEEDK